MKQVFNEDLDQCQTNGCSGNQELTQNYFETGNLEKQLSDVQLRHKRGTCICAHAWIFFKLCIIMTHYIQTMKMYLLN